MTHWSGLLLLESNGEEWALCSTADGLTPDVLARAPAPLRNLRSALRERGVVLGLDLEDLCDAEAWRLRALSPIPRRPMPGRHQR